LYQHAQPEDEDMGEDNVEVRTELFHSTEVRWVLFHDELYLREISQHVVRAKGVPVVGEESYL